MRLDREQDREIIAMLIENAVVPVSSAPAMLDLLQRVREAPVEEDCKPHLVVTTTSELAKTH